MCQPRPSLRLLLTALALAPALGCSDGSDSFAVTVAVPSDVARASTEYVLKRFGGLSCSSIIVRPGTIDVARTSTPTSEQRTPSADGFEPIPRDFDVQAVDVRALSASGTPIAARCLTLLREVDEARLELQRYAPAGSRFSVIQNEAITVGERVRPLEVEVTDPTGAPLDEALVSIDRALPLFATDAAGLARIGTPTTTEPIDRAVQVEVYGIADPPVPARVRSLSGAACPELAWRRPLVLPSRSAEARVEVTQTDAVLIEATTATVSRVTVLRARPGRLQLELIASATVAGAPGALAAAEDPRSGALIVITKSGGTRLEVFSLQDRTLRRHPAIELSAKAIATPISVSALELIPLGGALDLFVGAAELEDATLRIRSETPGIFEAALGSAAFDVEIEAIRILPGQLIGDDDVDLLVADASEIVLFEGDGARGFFEPTSSLRRASAVAHLARIADAILVVDRSPRGDTVSVVEIRDFAFSEASALFVEAELSSAAVLDLNGDGAPDVATTERDAVRRFVGDGASELFEVDPCPFFVGAGARAHTRCRRRRGRGAPDRLDVQRRARAPRIPPLEPAPDRPNPPG